MPNFNDLASDGLVRHNISLLRYDAKLRRQILGQMRVLEQSILEQLGGKDITAFKRARLDKLLTQVDGIVKGNYAKMNRFMAGEMGDLAVAEHTFGAQQLNSLYGVDVMSAGLSPSALRAMSKEASIFGAPAAEHWGRQSASLRRRFADQVRQGYLLGETTGDIVRRVRGSATGARQMIEIGGKAKSVPVFSGGIMNVSTREAQALVRTSVSSVANEVRMETYMQNTDVIDSLVTIVTLDARTSDICQAKGARPDEWTLPDFEPVGSSGSYTGPPPWHFNCRSTLAPNTKSWKELQAQGGAAGATRNQKAIARKLDNNAAKATRASMTGQVQKQLGYGQWLKTQPKSVQLEALGPTRRKLWKEGKLNLQQQIDQTGRPLSLREMGVMDSAAIGRKLPTVAGRHARLGEPAGFIAPPQVPKLTRFEGLQKGHEFTWTDGKAYKVHKVTSEGVEALPWSTRTGKYVTPRNRIKLKSSTTLPPETPPGAPPNPPPAKKYYVGNDATLPALKEGDIFYRDGVYYKVVGKTDKSLTTARWYSETKRYETGRRTIFDFKKPISKPPVTKPPTKIVTLPPKSPFVPSSNYRTLSLGDTFTDEAGNVWKVYGKSNRGVKVVPWSTKSHRFLAPRNGKTLGYTSEPAKTVKQFTQSTANATKELEKAFYQNEYVKGAGYLQDGQLATMNQAIRNMGENGFNKGLAKLFGTQKYRANVFNMGSKGRLKAGDGIRSIRKRWDGMYSFGEVRNLGVRVGLPQSRAAAVWTHEFGHHIDNVLFWNRQNFRPGYTMPGLSVQSEALMFKLDNAYKGMLTEYRAASKTIGKKIGLRMRGVMSPGQQNKNWHRITDNMTGTAQSSYSLRDKMEWIAESTAHYFGQEGSRALMMKWQPQTYEFFQTLMSKELEPLWKELMR